jgi:hypothetical protein
MLQLLAHSMWKKLLRIDIKKSIENARVIAFETRLGSF